MNFRKFATKYIPLILIAILIITLAVISLVNTLSSPDFEGNRAKTIVIAIIKTLPTLITLVVQVLLVSANRNAFLLGGCNAALYGISYILQGLHFSAISALLISSPIQIISFFTWKKNSSGKEVKFKRMSPPVLALTLGLILAGWAGCYFGLSRFFEGSYPALDTLTFSIGTVVTFIVAMRYIESQYMNTVSCLIVLVMYIMMSIKDPSNMSYIVISLYNLVKIIQAAVSWTGQYIAQTKNEKNNESSLN